MIAYIRIKSQLYEMNRSKLERFKQNTFFCVKKEQSGNERKTNV